jgi:hypothetical protein
MIRELMVKQFAAHADPSVVRTIDVSDLVNQVEKKNTLALVSLLVIVCESCNLLSPRRCPPFHSAWCLLPFIDCLFGVQEIMSQGEWSLLQNSPNRITHVLQWITKLLLRAVSENNMFREKRKN